MITPWSKESQSFHPTLDQGHAQVGSYQIDTPYKAHDNMMLI